MLSPDTSMKDDYVSFSSKNIFRTFLFWPRIFKLLWETHAPYLMGILFVSLLKGVLPAVVLIATRELINHVVGGVSKGDFRPVLLAFGFLIVLNVISDLFNIVDGYFRKMFQSLLSNRVNLKIIEKAHQMTLQSFEDADVQNKLQRAQAEANYRPFEIFVQILAIISSVVTLFSACAILVAWKWWVIFVIFLIPCLSFYSFLRIGQREFNTYYRRAAKQRESWYLSFLVTRDNSFKEIKIFQLGHYLRGRYMAILKEFFKEDKFLAARRSYTSLVFQIINQGACGFVVFLAVYSAYMGQILLGNLISFIQAITLTQSTSQSVVQGILSLCQNNLYVKQLFDFLDLPEEEEVQGSGQKISDIQSLEFRNVSFKYPNTERNALSNVSFTLNKNEKLAIVGKNGSGKSTIVKLITLLYSDFEGDILINGKSIRDLNKESFREKMGVVFQDFVQYEMTVRDNVGFGDVKDKENDQLVWNAVEQSGITELVQRLPNKLNTVLGKWFEDGQQLSGGQWQRVAIARAFMRNADIYILDEPSSYLDPHSEREVFGKFEQLTCDKIGVFISHRLSTARTADKIILLENGRIIEEGTHESLMRLNGTYSEMFEIQASSYRSTDDSGSTEKNAYWSPLVSTSAE
ncbi:ABC transporter ATP-binding protein [Paenibacillus sp. VCA1]|uniref:ABC transporter ATP-binding protein n=1 Tax=Paenibacillus sp. VCA1 TaxID=3039148 RepID=UPI00287298FD|nr:ABC transporter ATP-binding protein [Paenibacillus sp. VCA1]MDR9857740.1 ABC transporter ATP-binding protein [Paenibacillus sp. VCA1]